MDISKGNYITFIGVKQLIISCICFIFGPILLVVSLIFFDESLTPKLSMVFAVFSTVLCLDTIYSNGIEFNFDNKRYRKYTKLLFYRVGDWFSLTGYSRLVYREYSYIPAKQDTDVTSDLKRPVIKDYQIYLLDDFNRKLKVATFSDETTALEMAKTVSTKLDIELQILKH